MIDLTGITKIEFTAACGLAFLTRNGKIERCEGDDAYELMALCGREDASVDHIEHNAGTASDLEAILKDLKN